MKFFVAMCLFCVLTLSGGLSFAQTTSENDDDTSLEPNDEDGVDSSAEDPERTRLEKKVYCSGHLIGWGVVSTLIGIPGVVTGIALIIHGQRSERSDEDVYMGPAIDYIVGGVLGGISLIPLTIGTIMIVKGSLKRKRALERLNQLPSVSLTSGGLYNTRLIGMSWSF